MAKTFTDKSFETEVLKSEKVVLVDFWAPWCGPCQMMGPIIDELAKDLSEKAVVGKINIDENPQTPGRFQVMNIPAIKIFKNGQVVSEFLGVQSKEVLKEAVLKQVEK